MINCLLIILGTLSDQKYVMNLQTVISFMKKKNSFKDILQSIRYFNILAYDRTINNKIFLIQDYKPGMKTT